MEGSDSGPQTVQPQEEESTCIKCEIQKINIAFKSFFFFNPSKLLKVLTLRAVLKDFQHKTRCVMSFLRDRLAAAILIPG